MTSDVATMTYADLLHALLGDVDPSSRLPVIGIDGRSGSGKSTTAARLAEASDGIAVIHTDDLAWHHSFFGWDVLLVDGLLTPLRETHPPLSFRPPAWEARHRPGAIHVPAATRAILVEGVGACRLSLHDWYDATVWVQADPDLAYQRVVARNDDPVDFVDDWTRAEVAFLSGDRPWERATFVVDGEASPASPLAVFATAGRRVSSQSD